MGKVLPISLKLLFHSKYFGLLWVSLLDLPSLSPRLRFFARSGPLSLARSFVNQSVLIGWVCPGLRMVNMSE